MFNPTESTTYHASNDAESITYGSGAVKGNLAQDVITSGQIQVNLTFLLTNEGESIPDIECDGILGLGPYNTHPNFIETAYQSGILTSDIYGFYLDYDANPGNTTFTHNAYLAIDYIPPQYLTILRWFDVTMTTYWGVEVLQMTMNGKDYTAQSPANIIFDTGSSGAYFSTALVNDVLTILNTTNPLQPVKIHGYKQPIMAYQCNKTQGLPIISVIIRGVEIQLTANDYLVPLSYPNASSYCNLLLSPGAENVGFNVLGDIFIRKSFVSYSKSNMQVGLSSYASELNLINNQENYLYSTLLFVLIMIILMLTSIIHARRKHHHINETEIKLLS